MRPYLRAGICLLLLAGSAPLRADRIDDFIHAEIRKRHIPGLSLAIIQQGKIIKAKGYGVTEQGGETPVTPSTLFQAGSISKSVAALGALHLVEQGKLSLDEDVNGKLTTWKVPENEFTKEKKVTLRGILSHSAGLTVHGFPGYASDEARPTLVQILNGEKPANTPAIRVDIVPGSQWRYAGGGYMVMQQMILDVTGEPFPRFMQETVLGPLGMSHSTYEQPLPEDKAKDTAAGCYPDRSPVKGRWHIYPEMAAAGLWTTPSDLARFAIGIQRSLAGTSNPVISQEMTRQMLTPQKENDGLGVFLDGSGPTLVFSHNGRDEGFDAMLMASAETGQGAVIMINANDNSRMIPRILEFIAKEYHWPGNSTHVATKHPPAKVDLNTLMEYTGRYEFQNNQMMTFTTEQGRLFTLSDGFPDEEFVPEAKDQFTSTERDMQITFVRDSSGQVSGFAWKAGRQGRTVPRIGPLIHSLKRQTDPDPSTTQNIEKALQCLAQGQAATVSNLITPGALTDFGGGPVIDLAGIQSLAFLAEQDVSDRQIERHGGKVDHIRYYSMATEKSPRYVLVYMTANGLVTDIDAVRD